MAKQFKSDKKIYLAVIALIIILAISAFVYLNDKQITQLENGEACVLNEAIPSSSLASYGPYHGNERGRNAARIICSMIVVKEECTVPCTWAKIDKCPQIDKFQNLCIANPAVNNPKWTSPATYNSIDDICRTYKTREDCETSKDTTYGGTICFWTGDINSYLCIMPPFVSPLVKQTPPAASNPSNEEVPSDDSESESPFVPPESD